MTLLRRLPAVDRVLERPEVDEWARQRGYGRDFLRRAVDSFLEGQRRAIREGRIDGKGLDACLDEPLAGVAAAAEALLRFHLRPVINATGVVVHTNLGRSPWSAAAAERVQALAGGYLNLEYDLEEGERGRRDAPVERLFRHLLPEAAVAAVNNNAAAVLLVLNTFAEGKEVVVSRGQLVEIGGSFRIPEVMAKGGAILREVGTTNRTRAADFERAIGERTGLLLSVHPSNYRVVGFTESVSLEELVDIGRRHDVPVVEDMGSGNLLDLGAFGIADEPSVAERLDSGVDLVTFSGDKLLGGPQAGFIVGVPEAVARCRSNPLYRALRLDKSIMLALEATLAAYLTGKHDELPTLAMLGAGAEQLCQRAEALAARLCAALSDASLGGTSPGIEVIEVASRVGGGAAPEKDLPSWGVAIATGDGPDRLAARLRRTDPPVIARIVADRLVLDVRTLLPADEDRLVPALVSAISQATG